mgnify:CR=1 FL=1
MSTISNFIYNLLIKIEARSRKELERIKREMMKDNLNKKIGAKKTSNLFSLFKHFNFILLFTK